MKFALAFVLVAISIAVASAGLTCYTDESKCAEDECCIKVGVGMSIVGMCKKIKQIDETCQMHQGKSPIKSHVYYVSCPCAEGLKCKAKDGIMGNLVGTCQAEDDE